jgi:Beta-galactosidase
MYRSWGPLLVAAQLPAFAFAQGPGQPAPLRTAAGEPLVCIYFFPHWWEPWKSSEERVLADMRLLRGMGFNALLLDHEWSQMIDGNWRLLDRAHRLAKEAGLSILPWLSAKVWSDMGDGNRPALVKEQYGVDLSFGVNQKGERTVVQPWDEATIKAGAAYCRQYLERYAKDGALLHLRWQGEARPVVALTVELAWGGPSSFDDQTNAMFRAWVAKRYETVAAVNGAWGTDFRAIDDIDPRQTEVFDYDAHLVGKAAHPQAVEDHIEFRAETVNAALERQKALLRETWPNALIASELPYQIAAAHPHAQSYRIAYGANPTMANHADLLVLRMTGLMSPPEKQALAAYAERRRMPTVLAYRTYPSTWGLAPEQGGDPLEGFARQLAEEAAGYGNGLGFYSFNEMVDVHVEPGGGVESMVVTEEQSRVMLERLRATVALYREMCEPHP